MIHQVRIQPPIRDWPHFNVAAEFATLASMVPYFLDALFQKYVSMLHGVAYQINHPSPGKMCHLQHITHPDYFL